MPDSLRDQLQRSLGTAFTIGRELPRGGMSRVFVAYDEHLGREVVIKALLPELSQTISAERFTREIRLAAALQEPHIVPVLAAGETADGTPYYIMPFVRGESLRSRMTQVGTSIASAVSVLRDIASALAYAHRQGIVHRDIKPENVLVSEGTCVVTDFGIAKAIGASATHDAPAHGTLTQRGMTVGTPAYMAPEQGAGDVVDHRADIYAFGVIAYELLAGVHPFGLESTAQHLIASHISATPLPLAERRAHLPRALTDLVMHCLQKDPSARPQSVEEILAVLDTINTTTDPAGTIRDSPAAWKASRVRVLAAIVVAVALIGGVFAWRGRHAADNTIRSLVVAPFENVGGDSAVAYLSHGVTDELTVTLGRIPGLRVAPRVTSSAASLAPADLARAMGVQGVLSGSVRRSGDRLRISAELSDIVNRRVVWSDQFEEDRKDLFAVEDRITQSIVQAMQVRLAAGTTAHVAASHRTANADAHDLYLRGRYFWSFRSETGIARAIEYFTQAVSRDSGFVAAISGLADAYAVSAWYSYVPPLEGYGRAKELAQRAIRLDSTLAEPHASLGYAALYYDWDWPTAERELLRSIQLDSNYATAHQWYGNYLVAMNRPIDAVASLRRAQERDPLNRVTVGAVCWGQFMLHQYRDAVAQCGKALDIDSTFAVARTWNGQALSALGDTAAAFRELQAGVRLSNRSSVAVAALAHAYALAGRARDARTLLDELTSAGKRYTPTYEIALVHAALGERAAALDWLDRAYEERSHSIVFLGVDPGLDPVRKEPRFTAMMSKVGLH